MNQPAQQQELPGQTGQLRPQPDHGEESYRGSGRAGSETHYHGSPPTNPLILSCHTRDKRPGPPQRRQRKRAST